MTPDDHKIVQFAGDSKPVNDDYVGKPFEITVDKDNWAIRLHDGVTPGGHEILNIDSLSEMFQARSLELDGLLGFKDQDRGLLARLGPATYRLRTLSVNAATMKVTYGNGYGGNPVLDFADTISRDLEFTGDTTFTQQIAAAGGVEGDVVGDVTGNLTGNVDGDVVGDLTGDSSGTHTGPQVGDVDVRGKTLRLDDGQVHLAALNSDVTDYVTLNSAPLGAILMWGGVLDEIPENWNICDGSNGTPDLRDRFIMGALGNKQPGDTGGTDSLAANITIVEAGDHTHAFTDDGTALTVDQMPAHKHGSGVCDTDATPFNHGTIAASPPSSQGLNNHDSGNVEGLTTTVGGGNEHTHSGTTGDAGTHTHDVTSEAVDSLPPYMALCFIMRIS